MSTLYSALDQFELFVFYNGIPTSPISNFGLALIIIWANLQYFIGKIFFNLKERRATVSALRLPAWRFAIAARDIFLMTVFKQEGLRAVTFFSYTILIFVIFFSNIFGLFPYALTITSFISFTFFWSSFTLFQAVILGFQRRTWRYFKMLAPNGTPIELEWFIVLVEIVSFIARAFSLAIRLFANMLAGHALLKVLSSFFFIIVYRITPFFLFGFAVWALVLVITIMESLVALLQAYVYVSLAGMYLKEAIA